MPYFRNGLILFFLSIGFPAHAQSEFDAESGICTIGDEQWVLGFDSLQRFIDVFPGAVAALGFSDIREDCERARDAFLFQRERSDDRNRGDMSDSGGLTAREIENRLKGGENFGTEIAGGLNSTYMPAIGLLFSSPQNPYFCGGVLVNEDWIMTSAHCVPGGTSPRERDTSIMAFVETVDGTRLICLTGPGETDVTPPDQRTNAPCDAYVTARAHLHPDWDGGQYFGQPDDEDDIALIRVDTRASAPRQFAFFDRYSVQEDDWVTVDGYSFGNRGLETSNFDRRRGIFKVDDVDGRDIEFDSSESYQVCRGDSGSPVRIEAEGRYLVAGLISQLRIPPWSDDRCGEEGAGTQATRIWSPKEAWIEAIIGRQCVEIGRTVRCFGPPADDHDDQDPPPICPVGQKCCEPRPGGGCDLCVPDTLSCF